MNLQETEHQVTLITLVKCAHELVDEVENSKYCDSEHVVELVRGMGKDIEFIVEHKIDW